MAMKSDDAEKRRELAEETGFVMTENDLEKNLQEFLKRKKSPVGKNACATNNGSSVVSPSSPKKARRSQRQKWTQNDECPFSPSDNGNVFSPIKLYNCVLAYQTLQYTSFPLDANQYCRRYAK
jgi:hypothetical protein